MKIGSGVPAYHSLACVAGMGLYLAWIVGSSFTSTLLGVQGSADLRLLNVQCSVLTTIVVLVGVVLWSRTHEGLSARNLAVALAGVCAVLYPVIALVGAAIASGSVALVAVGAVSKGVASALLFLLWNELFCRESLKQVGVFYSGAYLLSVVLQAGMSVIPVPAAVCVEVVLGAGSAGLLLVARAGCAESAERTEREESLAWTFPYKPLVIVVMFTFAAFFIRQFIPNSNSPLSWVGGGVVSLATLAGCLLLYEKHFDASKLQYIAVPLLVAGVLLYCLLGREGASWALVLVDAGNVAFRIFLLVMMCNICYRFHVPSLWLFGVMRIAMIAAEGVAVTLGVLAVHNKLLVDDFAITAAAYVLVVLLVTVVALAQHDESLVQSTWSIMPKGEKGATRAERLEAVIGAREMLLWRCGQVARLYGLTHREEEILGYLADGKTKREIREELVVSEGTVRTHVAHIYSKLGVHSREEAVRKLQEVG